MRRQVLFVQGGGDGAHQIDARLAASLSAELGPDYEVHYPAMPNEGSPDYAPWTMRLAEEIEAMGDGAILVAHSVGATILVRYLAEGPVKRHVAGVFLIAAPFVGKGGWAIEDVAPMDDIGDRLPRNIPIHLYHGREDEIAPFAHVELYARALPQAVVHRLSGRDHQLNDDLSEVAGDIKRLG